MRPWIVCALSLGLCTSGFAWESEVTVVARRILQEMRSTHYTHTLLIDERERRYDTDCSGFAMHVLDQSARPAAEELERAAPGKRPLARDFVAVFQKHSRSWETISHVRNLIPGDLIAWLLPAGSSSNDTGHVMIVNGRPRANANRKNEFLISVIDASASGHGKADPRRKAGPNGVGTGVNGLVVDAKGLPRAFYWSGGESTAAKATTIRMGRPR